MKCCLCHQEIEVEANGWANGHNAQPLAEGRCCGDCNVIRVLPTRWNRVIATRKRLIRLEADSIEEQLETRVEKL